MALVSVTMKIFLPYFISLLLVSENCGLTHYQSVNHPKTMQSNYALVEKLEAAINGKVDVCEIDEVIGIRSLINTCREEDRLVLNHADFGPDPDDEASFQELHKAKDVAYWKVDHPSLAKIVGLCWYEDGTVKLFKAIVFPP
jgi:hypothetical protein